MLNLKNRKYISLVFYYCLDKCVSLVLLLAYGRGRVFVRITVHYPAPGHCFNYSNSDRPSPTYNVIYKGAKIKVLYRRK